MEKKKPGTVTVPKENVKELLGKAKDGIVKAMDQNGDGTFDMKDVSVIAGSIGNAAKDTISAMKESTEERGRIAERKALCPIFADDLDSADFALTKLIRITDIDKKRAESEVCRDSIGYVKGFLDEYAYYTAALLSLYEVDSDENYLKRAEEICKEAQRQFSDKNEGGYFLYGSENDRLITRPKETYDGAVPSGNSVMAYCLVRLAHITGSKEDQTAAERQLAYMSGEAQAYPAGHTLFLISFLLYENPPQKITVVLVQPDRREEIISSLPLYAEIKILNEETEEYPLLNGRTTYYICKDYTCLPPVNEDGLCLNLAEPVL